MDVAAVVVVVVAAVVLVVVASAAVVLVTIVIVGWRCPREIAKPPSLRSSSRRRGHVLHTHNALLCVCPCLLCRRCERRGGKSCEGGICPRKCAYTQLANLFSRAPPSRDFFRSEESHQDV